MSKTIYSLIGVTAVSVAVLNIPATTATSASSQAQASVNVHTTCSMTATVNTAHNATLISGTYSSGDYPDGIGKTTIQTFCNDQSGYAIYAIGFTNNQLGSTVLKGASLSSDYDIATGTATSGDTSSWAMKISAVSGTYAPTINNGYSSFSTVPSSWTKVASLTSSTDSTSTTNIGSKIETTYAAYISNAQPAGTYSGQVKYALVHPSVTPESYVMQDVADWGNNLLPGVQYNATDSRDGKEYTVALLEDGNVWMTKNLDLAGGTTLTPANSNVTTNYTLPASRTSANGGVTLDGGFDNDAVADVYNSNSTTCGDNRPCYSYYSHAAATAGTNQSSGGEAVSDICPKGWKLPTRAEFEALMSLYTTGVALTASPFYGVYNGAYDRGSFLSGGEFGSYWSSTISDAEDAQGAGFNSSMADIGESDKNFGFSVRCIKDNRQVVTLTTDSGATGVAINGTNYTSSATLTPGTYTISGNYSSGYEFNSWSTSGGISVASTSSASTTLTVTGAGTLTLGTRSCATTISGTMQDFEPCSSIINGTTGTLTDSRDGTSYAVGKLADGKFWLLDNLALDLTDSAVQSKLNSTTTNAANATLAYLKNGGGTTSDQYATASVAAWTSDRSYSAPLIATSGTGDNGDWTKDTEVALAAQQSGTGKIGVYYNYCAASAGSYCYGDGTSAGTSSGDATEDICPAGWRLPTGGGSGEYKALYTAYSSDNAAFVNALRTPLSGYFFFNNLAGDQGSSGYFWSSTRYDDYYWYYLYVGTSGVAPQVSNIRAIGGSVRCILGS